MNPDNLMPTMNTETRPSTYSVPVLGMDDFSAVIPPKILLFGKLAIAHASRETFPEWQVKAMKQIMRKLTPTLKAHEIAEFLNTENSSPSITGRMLGHFHALFHTFTKNILPAQPEGEKVAPLVAKVWPTLGLMWWESVFNEYTLAEAQVFLCNYLKALSSSMDQTGKVNLWKDDALILAILLYCPGEVSSIKNTTGVHEFLVKTVGSNLTGSLKRVRGICTRIGLSFPDKGGRRKTRKPR
jgi:hypothetical protein